MPKIIVCCFGITRSLPFTITSVKRNVLGPATRLGQAQTFCHFFDQTEAISTSGSREGQVDVSDAKLLSPDKLELEPPGACLELWDFDAICGFGDSFDNNFVSLRNLVHQLHSLRRVTRMALDADADIVVFCRPDLKYHDTLEPVIARAVDMMGSGSAVFLPSWQPWGGYNDRFAVAVGTEAITAYGTRIERAIEYCQSTASPLNSERLVKFCLTEAGIPVHMIPTRASRIRANGRRVWESFGDHEHALRRARLKKQLWTMLDKSGLKPLARRVAKTVLRRS